MEVKVEILVEILVEVEETQLTLDETVDVSVM